MTTAATARPSMVFWPEVKPDQTEAARRRATVTSRAIRSDTHVHDLVERLHGLVADGDGELRGQRRFGGGDHVVVDVGQVAGGGLDGQAVGLRLTSLQPVEGLDERLAETLRPADGA